MVSFRRVGIVTEVSDETTATTFGIDSPETFLFLSFLNDTHCGHEETNQDHRETENSRECLVEHVVSDADEFCRTAIILRERWIGTESAYFYRGVVEEPTALQFVLHCYAVVWRCRIPDASKVVLLSEGHKPQVRTVKNGYDAVHNENPIENSKTDGDVILLDDGAYRDDKCDNVDDTQSQGKVQV